MSAAGGRPKLQSKLWRPFHRSDFGYHSDLLRKQLEILGDLSSQFKEEDLEDKSDTCAYLLV